MKTIDLSHPIHPDIPVYPGTEPPQISPANSIDRDGFAEIRISMYSHTATHIDAPCHSCRKADLSISSRPAISLARRWLSTCAPGPPPRLLSSSWRSTRSNSTT
ncbi:MAG: hypothetical protein C0619_11100 [Desulfuromonas sp.]|nr:MAG: hypothetical protein C0619_11100 [Desulfuromonas sp.]